VGAIVLKDIHERFKVLDLFSGIGGFSLGLERTGGFETVAFCEIEPYPRAVLAKHWPNVPCYDDVRTLTAERLAADGISVDVICGGFPCQDISTAGRGAGIDGERSGLWREYARLIGELRPRYVIVENVAALLGRGLDRVLGDLAAFGFDAEWHCIPASAVGAPHRRDRIWIVAHAPVLFSNGGNHYARGNQEGAGAVPESGNRGCHAGVLAHAYCPRLPDIQGGGENAKRAWLGAFIGSGFGSGADNNWRAEPAVGRVAHGVPSRVDRLKSLGNAVVPQIPEILGRAILQAESGLT
jgi:DNA (cytosine-5)-methyltransferase 1